MGTGFITYGDYELYLRMTSIRGWEGGKKECQDSEVDIMSNVSILNEVKNRYATYVTLCLPLGWTLGASCLLEG